MDDAGVHPKRRSCGSSPPLHRATDVKSHPRSCAPCPTPKSRSATIPNAATPKTYVFLPGHRFHHGLCGLLQPVNTAISSGLEWNVKVTRRDLPTPLTDYRHLPELLQPKEFEYYSEDQKGTASPASLGGKILRRQQRRSKHHGYRAPTPTSRRSWTSWSGAPSGRLQPATW